MKQHHYNRPVQITPRADDFASLTILQFFCNCYSALQPTSSRVFCRCNLEVQYHLHKHILCYLTLVVGFVRLGLLSFDIASIMDFARMHREHGNQILLHCKILKSQGGANQSPLSVMISSGNTCQTSHAMGEFSITAGKIYFFFGKATNYCKVYLICFMLPHSC